MGRVQRSVSMGNDVWDMIYEYYPKLGFKTHSMFVEACVIYGFKHKYHEKISKVGLEHLRAYEEVGKHAEAVKPILFMSMASKTYDEAEKRLKRNVKLGLMTKEQKNKNLKRLHRKLWCSVQKIDSDQAAKENEAFEKRRRIFLKKHGCKVTKSGKIRKA